jgi:hypothetical protein
LAEQADCDFGLRIDQRPVEQELKQKRRRKRRRRPKRDEIRRVTRSGNPCY